MQESSESVGDCLFESLEGCSKENYSRQFGVNDGGGELVMVQDR